MDTLGHVNRLAFNAYESESSPPPAGGTSIPDGVLFNDISPIYDSADGLGLNATETQFMPYADADNTYDVPASVLQAARQHAGVDPEGRTADATTTPTIYDSLDDAFQEQSARAVVPAPSSGFDNEVQEPALYDALDDIIDKTATTNMEKMVPAMENGSNYTAVMTEPILYDSLDSVLEGHGARSSEDTIGNVIVETGDALYETLEEALNNPQGIRPPVS